MHNNKNYWVDRDNRAKRAKEHTADMQNRYACAIEQSAQKTIIYSPEQTFCAKGGPTTVHVVCEPTDSVSAAFAHANGKTCILNFASYKEPGGMFLAGSRAQEECLCHESFLYNVLSKFGRYYEWNSRNLNRALYRNRALYTPGIVFEHPDSEGSVCRRRIDVLTCAAPNFSAARKYQNVSREENREVLRSRIEFILSILAKNDVDTAILGAYGCGVFGQDASEVAVLFKEATPKVLAGRKMDIVFAVINNGDGNYEKFARVFG
jgi:uncharacterized protein (TIGR02452 family)